MVKRIVWTVAVVVLALAAYLALWPVPIRAASWKPPPVPGYAGPHAPNDKLAGLTLIPSAPSRGRSTSCSAATASSTPPWPAATSCA
jgi:hypothetical protein